MKKNLFVSFFILAFGPLAFAQIRSSDVKNDIEFLNIAPGEYDREAMKSLPVRIQMVSESGAPYAGVFIRIFNASGLAVFKQLCEKPWLLLNLPRGEYNVIAVDRKKVQRQKAFKVKDDGETIVKLAWPKKVTGY